MLSSHLCAGTNFLLDRKSVLIDVTLKERPREVRGSDGSFVGDDWASGSMGVGMSVGCS